MTATALLLAGWGTDLRRMEPLAVHLREQGIEAHVWPYRPAGTITALAEQLADAVRWIDAADDGPVHLVGHSFGGILAAAAALQVPTSVASVTTINAPWRGTWVSLTGSSRLADALRWRSPQLAALRRRMAAHADVPTGPSWLVVSVLGDLATPATTALRVGARGPRIRRRLVALGGHSLSLLEPQLQAVVTAHVLQAGSPDPAHASATPGPTTADRTAPRRTASGQTAFTRTASGATPLGALGRLTTRVARGARARQPVTGLHG